MTHRSLFFTQLCCQEQRLPRSEINASFTFLWTSICHGVGKPASQFNTSIFGEKESKEHIINHLLQQRVLFVCLHFSLLCSLGPADLVASSVQLVTWQQDTIVCVVPGCAGTGYTCRSERAVTLCWFSITLLHEGSQEGVGQAATMNRVVLQFKNLA